jgi:hypothetical protein
VGLASQRTRADAPFVRYLGEGKAQACVKEILQQELGTLGYSVSMQLTIHVPDDILEGVKDKLPPRETGVLEAIALDAVLGFLMKLGDSPIANTETTRQ